MRSNLSFINVYNKKNIKSEVVTQLLYGDSFKIIKYNSLWIKIKNDSDGYKGFIKNKKYLLKEKNTHKVSNLFALLYSAPSSKNKIKKKLSFGSKIMVKKEKNKFLNFDNMWIKKKDLKKINYKSEDIFKNINKFLNIKYSWGGKHYSGIDCSGLVQLFLNFNNKYCPRDTKDQIKYFRKKIKLNNVKKNDLIFWKGHVAVVVSKKSLVHAYGPFKRTVCMSIKKTIRRIYNSSNLKVIGIRRVV